MDTGQVQSEQEQGNTPYYLASIESQKLRNGSSIEYDDLLRRYAEAMIRISQLESQLAEIIREQRNGTAGSNYTPNTRSTVQHLDVGPVLKEVAELEARASTESVNGSKRETVVQAHSIASPLNGADIAQLRLHVTSLASKLAQTQVELERSLGTHVKRRGHHKRKSESRWGFWRGSKRR